MWLTVFSKQASEVQKGESKVLMLAICMGSWEMRVIESAIP
jgi:hypothetical protein